MHILKTYSWNIFLLCLAIAYLSSCAVQPVALYDQKSNTDTVSHIGNFYATQIFKDYTTSEVWYTDTQSCLQVDNLLTDGMIGKGGLYIKWNRTSGGCNWVGLGFGWDEWVPKNIRSIYNDAAIQFKVRSPKGTQNGLPWAMAFEDYGDVQAWAGVFSNYIEGQKITENWTTVEIPLRAFDFTEFNADMTSIKQLIIQFESEGEIYLDELKIVPASGFQSKIQEVMLTTSTPVIDGIFDESIYVSDPFDFTNGKLWMSVNDNAISVYAAINDNTPLQNKNTGKDIWNGDAIEIAFSTNSEANPLRKAFLLSDQHIGIRANADPMIWNWQSQTAAEGNVITKKTESGYILEATIPTSQFIAGPFIAGKTFGIEIAVDEGDMQGRKYQYRWNNPYNEGFNTSPQIWGRMQVISNEANK